MSPHFLIRACLVLHLMSHVVDCKLAGIICDKCDQREPSCKYGPNPHVTCPNKGDGCFTYYFNDTLHGRGCAPENSQLYTLCNKDNRLNCFLCYYPLCNSNPMRFRRKLACVTSTATPEEKPNLMPEECPGELPIGSPDYCYMLVGMKGGKYTVVNRGCYPYEGVVAKNQALFYCSDQGCNMYSGGDNGVECRLANKTHVGWVTTGESGTVTQVCDMGDGWPPLCYNRLSGPEYSDGCLSRLRNPTKAKDCSFYLGGNRKCQTCLTPAVCNRFTNAHTDDVQYNFLSKCRNLKNEPVVCTGVGAKCYLYMDSDNGKELETGCVEPTSSVKILTSQSTIFCVPKKHPYDGCFDLDLYDYSKRLACFECNDFVDPDCHEPRTFGLSYRNGCNHGVRYCVTFVQGNKVMRGCNNPESQVTRNCENHPSMCQYCTTSYCNGLPMQPNEAKCYSTKSHVNDLDSTELRLIKCQSHLPAHTKQPCFIARKEGVALIKAGCIEDFDPYTSYQLELQGSAAIIFQQKMSCYKCRSATLRSCFNVRWLEPQLCSGYGRSALRGCYTIFDLKYERIERGCLSELEPYRTGICLAKHFEELCIVCSNSYCNIHTV